MGYTWRFYEYPNVLIGTVYVQNETNRYTTPSAAHEGYGYLYTDGVLTGSSYYSRSDKWLHVTQGGDVETNTSYGAGMMASLYWADSNFKTHQWVRNNVVTLPAYKTPSYGYRVKCFAWNGTTETTLGPGDVVAPDLGATWYLQTLFRPISYYFKFNANGGSGSMSNQEHIFNKVNTLSACTFTPPTGKVFKGWSFSSNGPVVYGDQETQAFNNDTSRLTNTEWDILNLYAIWEEDSSLKYISIKESGSWIHSRPYGTMVPYVKASGNWVIPSVYTKINDSWKLIYDNTYQYLDYIQLTGPAYINTGVTPNVNTNINATLAVNSTSSTTIFYGAGQSWWNNAIEGYLDASKWTARSGSSTSDVHTLYYSGSLNSQPKRYLYTGGTSNRTWTLYDNNDTQLYTGTFAASSGSSITPNGPLYIGALNRTTDGVVYNGSSISWKLYGFKIYNTSGILRNFVPVKRQSDNVYGLLDTKNNVFYSNSNSSGTITGV